MNKKIKVAAYCRVSTDMEDQLHSLSAQIKYFTEYISSHEDYTLIEVYYDEGITGTSVKKRDGFNRMIADCEIGKINLILTKEVSRFARNTIDTLSYTRKLKSLGVNILFMNDGIDTRDKDSELRLTIMASLAQEESRKISERVKWGVRRRMENGVVFGRGRIYGYKTVDGKLEIVPEEAEVVKRIFHMYLYENKGTTKIAQELNAEKITTLNGRLWSAPTLLLMLKNEKYAGDLTQWKYYTPDFLEHNQVKNKGDNPDIPLITVENHHEPIVPKEVFEAVNKEIKRRRDVCCDGRKYSGTYWYSSKVICGKCGKPFNLSGGRKDQHRKLRCCNRAFYGKVPVTDANGEVKGCDNKTTNEPALTAGAKYILRQIQISRVEIEEQLLEEIKIIQKSEPKANVKKLQEQIENLKQKKRNAIDLVLDGLISKEDLAEQNSYYDEQISLLTERISTGQNTSAAHKKQLDKIREYIRAVRETGGLDIDNTELYRDLVKNIVVYESKDERILEYYLNCVPFGFRVKYHMQKPNMYQEFAIIIDSCTVI